MIPVNINRTNKRLRIANPNLNPLHVLLKDLPHVVYYVIKKTNNSFLIAAAERHLSVPGDQLRLITQKTGRTLDIGVVKFVVKASEFANNSSQIKAIVGLPDTHFYMMEYLDP